MTTPGIIVLVAVIIAAILGIVVLVYRKTSQRRRILVEDALKHLYHCESSGVTCTVASLAGAIGRPVDAAARVLRELGERRLISFRGAEPVLTDNGRDYALKIIRVHRLWERHLADETTVRELDWHKEAELQEHKLSPDEVRSLSKRLGHPVYDPHGDPIPSPAGAIPREQGEAIETFEDGDTVRIVHVEDEPPTVYAELVAAGLYPGMTVTLRGRTHDNIVIDREGERISLSLLVAANVRVRKEEVDQYTGQRKTLASLNPGSSATVSGLSPACRGLQRRRLMDLGLVPGTPVTALMRSPVGDPTAYRIRGASIALRKQQAEFVFVE